jgi:hypothetical protein
VSWKPFAAIGGVVTAALSGLTAFLDPAFLMANPDMLVSLGFTVVKGGERLAPGLPWNKVVLVLVTAAIVLTLSKANQKRKEKS